MSKRFVLAIALFVITSSGYVFAAPIVQNETRDRSAELFHKCAILADFSQEDDEKLRAFFREYGSIIPTQKTQNEIEKIEGRITILNHELSDLEVVTLSLQEKIDRFKELSDLQAELNAIHHARKWRVSLDRQQAFVDSFSAKLVVDPSRCPSIQKNMQEIAQFILSR